jgi:hypothetical protein
MPGLDPDTRATTPRKGLTGVRLSLQRPPAPPSNGAPSSGRSARRATLAGTRSGCDLAPDPRRTHQRARCSGVTIEFLHPTGSVAPGPLYAEALDPPESRAPPQELIEPSRVVGTEMDPSRAPVPEIATATWTSAWVSMPTTTSSASATMDLAIGTGGWHQPAGRADGRVMGRLRRAPMRSRSARPVGAQEGPRRSTDPYQDTRSAQKRVRPAGQNPPVTSSPYRNSDHARDPPIHDRSLYGPRTAAGARACARPPSTPSS